jgi:arsenite methyltransferase
MDNYTVFPNPTITASRQVSDRFLELGIDTFIDACRVLKPGGRLAISDVVATAEIPQEVRDQAAMLTGCIAGATRVDQIESLLREAGFTKIKITLKDYSKNLVSQWFPGAGAENYVASADIEAFKPIG